MGLTKRQRYRRNYYERNKDRELALQKKYRKENREKVKRLVDAWKQKNKKRVRQLKAKWKKTLKGVLAEERYQARRREAMRRATPKWLTSEQRSEIDKFYENCPPKHHVDHEIPLLGENVCGLHVLWNLRYLPIKQNLVKGNRVAQEALKNESSTSKDP